MGYGPLEAERAADATAPDGDPSLDTSDLATAQADRNVQLLGDFAPAGGWSEPGFGLMAFGQRHGSLTAFTNGQMAELGSYRIPPEGNSFGTVDVWIHVVDSDGHVQFFANGAPFAAVNTDGWHKLTVGRSDIVSVHAQCIDESTTTVVTSICVLGTTAESEDYGKRALLDLQHKRPHGVSLIRAIDRLQTLVQNSYPRTLASHALLTPRRNAAMPGSDSTILRWRFWRGPFADDATFGGVDLWVLIESSDNNGEWAYGVKPDGGGTTTASDSAWGSAGTAVWRQKNIPAVAFTPNALHELVIDFGNTGGGNTRIHAVMMIEKVQRAEDDSLFATDGTRIDERPERFLYRAPGGLQPGSPIVGAYWLSALARQVLWSDVRSELHNALHAVTWRRQILVLDQPTYISLTTTLALGTDPALLRMKYSPARQGGEFQVWVRFQRTKRETGYFAAFQLMLDGVAVGDPVMERRIGGEPLQGEQWIALPWTVISDLTATYEVSVKAGFVDVMRNPVDPTDDTLIVYGMKFQEIPDVSAPSNQYFHSLPTTAPSNIPDDDPAGVSKTITSRRTSRSATCASGPR
jgi:hypothetical protein